MYFNFFSCKLNKTISRHTREHPLWSTLDAIQHIAIDPNQETLLITTLRKQLYYVKLFGVHMLQVKFCVHTKNYIFPRFFWNIVFLNHRIPKSLSPSLVQRCIMDGLTPYQCARGSPSSWPRVNWTKALGYGTTWPTTLSWSGSTRRRYTVFLYIPQVRFDIGQSLVTSWCFPWRNFFLLCIL